MSAIPEPAQRLAPQARWAWRLSWAGTCVVALMVLGAVGRELPGPWQTIVMALLVVALVAGTAVVPELRWRRWRWEVREHEIDLQRGILVVRRTLIPMARVQHVETERGLIGQALGLSTVEIHTAAGSHAIPFLRDGDAGTIRVRIAELARTDADGIAAPVPTDADEIAAPRPTDADEIAAPAPTNADELAEPARTEPDG